MHLPLENIKVLDLTRVLAGPYCTMVLADLGAEVVKVEMPGKGDDSRAFGPYVGDESAYFMSINRNKKSITLNLKTEEGKKLLKELVKQFDVLVENYRPGTMEKLGLGYDVLKEINPNLIYAASSDLVTMDHTAKDLPMMVLYRPWRNNEYNGTERRRAYKSRPFCRRHICRNVYSSRNTFINKQEKLDW